MDTQTPDEKVLTQYLLGYLPEDTQAQVEDRAFRDSDYLAALEEAEADLIDRYVRDELPRADRPAFERRFLTSPQRLSKVEFARALARLTAEAPELRSAASAKDRWWDDLFPNWSFGPRFAASLATLIVMVAAGWLAIDNAGMRSRIAALESSGRELQTRNDTSARQLSAERSRAASLASELEKQQSSRGGATPVIASLVLLPGLTRAETSRTQLLVPPSAQLARIEIQLETRDAYPGFRAELRTLGGQEVLTRGNLPRRQTGGGPAVSFDVPASALSPGDYELELSGISSDGAVQELGYYYFHVLKP